MELGELIIESVGMLTLNKVRTALAMLGVIIGIGSVITLVSLGQASQAMVESNIKALGSNLLTISPGAQSQGRVQGAAGGATTLTREDATAISSSEEITSVQSVAPIYSGFAQITAGRNNTNTQIYGVTPEYAIVFNLSTQSGSFISTQNVTAQSKIAVLGPTTAEDLFGESASAVGKTIRINSESFVVAGVTKSKGGSGFQNQDDRVYVPLTTAQKILFGSNYLSSIAVAAKSESVMDLAQNQIGYLLLERHDIQNSEDADFSIFSQADILDTASSVTGTFTSLLSGIAAISLVVGGIGIMNIMLVTVTERTREVGLRKALGAKKRDIVAQFLVESVIITFTGGAVGTLTGVVLSFVLSNSMSLPFTLSLPSIVVAFGVSAVIGLIFGLYPAQKAAKLEPIEALRYE